MVREIIVRKPFRIEEFMEDNYDSLSDMEFVKSIKREAKKEVFDDIETNCNIWDTDAIRGSSETKSGDKWLSMNIVKKLKKKHLGSASIENEND